MERREVDRERADFNNARRRGRTNPFIMRKGLGRLFADDNKMAEGPFLNTTSHVETPLGTNPLREWLISNPAARLYESALRMGRRRFHVRGRLTASQAFPLLDQTARYLTLSLSAERFVEISETLAAAKVLLTATVYVRR